jgi:Tfp pilus assembly protein PilX
MMHPYFVPMLVAVFQGICMLVLLAVYVFLAVVAWRFMKAQETMAGAVKDAAISLQSKE